MALKSLCYFDDIDFSIDIDYTGRKRTWTEIKTRIIEMVQNPEKQFEKI